MTALPSPLSLTNIADGAKIVAADHRNNYSAIQTAVDQLLTLLGTGTAGQVLLSNGGADLSFGASVAQVAKTTSKTWNTSSSESTDLLNGEIAVPQNIGTSASWELFLFMDILNNTGGNVTWTWAFKVGSSPTTLWKFTPTGAGPNAARRSVVMTVRGMNLGAANSQAWNLTALPPTGALAGPFTTGEGELMNGSPYVGGATSAIDTAAGTIPIVLTVQHSSNSALAETKLTGAVLKVKQS